MYVGGGGGVGGEAAWWVACADRGVGVDCLPNRGAGGGKRGEGGEGWKGPLWTPPPGGAACLTGVALSHAAREWVTRLTPPPPLPLSA